MPQPSDRFENYLLGKYKIQNRIGSGGMAEVYRGMHEKLNRTVAIKILHPSLMNDPEFTARFEREARLAANLRHPGIVQVFDFDMQGDLYFLVMEYIKGDSLKQHLESMTSADKQMPIFEITRMVTQIAESLDYAHAQGMLHRDLKPANILIDHNGNTYISDFGIARLVDSSEITRTGSILGTPAYMSPEQCEGTPLTPLSDLYSFGIVIYEMISGHVPFDAESALAVLQKHIHEPLPGLEDSRPDLPSGMDQFLQKALAKKPEERFSTAIEMARAFSALVPDYKEKVLATSTQNAGSSLAGRKAVSRSIREGRNNSTTWSLGIGIVIVILISTVILIWVARQSDFATIRRCLTPETCEIAAMDLIRENRPVLAVEAYVKAASLVPANRQKDWAKLKCDLGDLYVRVNKITEARKAYRECIAWTHNESSMGDLRVYAEQKLKDLK
jgi:serine/threonine protein kinase